MSDKRIRISLAEKRKYCDLIRSGANYKSVNQIYKTKHKIELPKRTFRPEDDSNYESNEFFGI